MVKLSGSNAIYHLIRGKLVDTMPILGDFRDILKNNELIFKMLYSLGIFL